VSLSYGRVKIVERMRVLAAKIGPVERALEIGIAGDRDTAGHPLPGANREFFLAKLYETGDCMAELTPDHVIDLEQGNCYPNVHADLVICSQVLEHLWKIQDAARTLYHLTKPGGYCIVDLPAAGTPWHYGGAGVGDWWRLTLRGLERLMCEAGFMVEDLYEDEHAMVSALCRKPK